MVNNYNKLNNLVGWIVFLISSFVYISTLEPTASFWDCGEFIATAFKLQVGHPPGAPLFLMLARIFMLFAGDVKHVAVMVNALSGLMSAFTILFLFWTITAFARKIAEKTGAMSDAKVIAILGSGVVGALAYTFSDSFWFSAVEGEVYASSSFFTAIVFWAILKWERVADERSSTRWIIFIAYLMGLSIGVHLLNLLAIPALAFVYYFKKYKPTNKGILITAVVGVLILGVIQAGIIPGVVKLAAYFDLFFVNVLGMPFNTGVLIYLLLMIGIVVWGLFYTTQKNKPVLNIILLCFAVIMIGYSSFTQIIVRSLANTPMDENNPENAFTFLSYLNREQYGDRPLLYGQYYTAKYIDNEEGEMTYAKLPGKESYVETGRKQIPVYDPAESTVFPRMYSSQPQHIQAYQSWSGAPEGKKPTFMQNLKFFFTYQVKHMYWRYFMWNFAGRQNDIQGEGSVIEGNWISGIKPIDNLLVGNQDKLPSSMKSNKAMNKFYLLPLLLGFFGVFYHFNVQKLDAWIVMLLFFFTGLAIVIYLNQTPYQPRERDYAYAGSFYAFAIWIGLGVMGLFDYFKDKLNPKVVAITATLVSLSVPYVMAKEGWDDHDRSRRYTARDFAYDYLNSCAPNAILFTNGDNDTFPLWYAQEVEGIRTDVRVVNLSLLNTDWYIDQLKRKAYESDPVPFSLAPEKYVQGTRDYVPFYDRGINEAVDLKELVDFIANDDPQAKVRTQGGGEMNYYPAKKFKLPVDTAEVVRNGTVPKELAQQVVSSMEWTVDRNYLMKADIMILDLLAHNNWKRPIYFAITVGNDSYLNLEEYFQLEGLAYRLVPVKNKQTNDGQTGRVKSDIMYNNLVNKFVYGNMSDPKVYLDENNIRMTMNFRNNFARLAETLFMEGKRDSAIKVLDKCMKEMPPSTVPYNIFTLRIAEMYYRLGSGKYPPGSPTLPAEIEKANKIVQGMAKIYEENLQFYFSLKGSDRKSVDREMNQAMAVMQELLRMTKEANQEKLVKEIEATFARLQEQYTRSATS